MLPIDIIFEILTRLPVKTLCNLRLVCKAWHALISDPNFQKSHHHRSKQNPLLLLISQQQNYHPGSYFRRQWQIVPTCLDLVCIYDIEAVYICNPTTRDIITVRQKTSQPGGCYNQKMAAFGYASSTMEYKILRLFDPFLSVNADYKLGV